MMRKKVVINREVQREKQMNKMRLSRRRFLQLAALSVTWLASIGRNRTAKANTKQVTTKPRVVVIGAGLGGLSCGAHLAKQGFPVTIIEQHFVPGGYASSFSRGRFNFEVSLHGTALADNATGRMLKTLGVSELIELVKLPAVYRLKTPELDITVPQKDPDAFIKLLTEHFPDEKMGIAQFINDLVTVAKAVDNLFRYSNSPFKLLTSLPYWTLWRIRNKTLGELLNGYVKDPMAREALVTLWGYYGLPPSRLSAFYFASATGSYLKDGSYYIKPRSQNLSMAFTEVIKTAGGKVQYGKAVEKIEVESNAVKGVVLANGETIPAQVVVSNASAPDTFKRLLPPDSVPSEFKEKLSGYRPSISTFILWLGLKQDITGIVESYNTHISSGRGPDADYQSYLNGEVNKGAIVVTLYDHLYKGYSEPGTSTLQILFLSGYQPWQPFEADYRAGRKQAYYEQKNKWAETLIRRVEENLVPGLSSMIEVKEAATPLTNWRYTRNPEGAIYGFEQATNNAFYNRMGNSTPVDGLYLASAWGNPGGGYVGVLIGGQQASQDIISDWGS